MKIDQQPAFVLHTYPYRETSLLVECFSRDYGRVSLVARGARRPRAEIRGQLVLFSPLNLSWFGKQELRTLAAVDWVGGQPQLAGEALLAGFYLNELLLKLLPRDDPHESIFTAYTTALAHLAHGHLQGGAVLRRFELALLAGAGYAPIFHSDVRGTAIQADAEYYFYAHHGAVKVQEASNAHHGMVVVCGSTLLVLAQPEALWTASHSVLREARQLLRYLLDVQLDFQPLASRALLSVARGGTVSMQRTES